MRANAGSYVADPSAARPASAGWLGNPGSYVAPPAPRASPSYIAPPASPLQGCFAVQNQVAGADTELVTTRQPMPRARERERERPRAQQQQAPPPMPRGFPQDGYPDDDEPPRLLDLLSSTFPGLAASLSELLDPMEPVKPPPMPQRERARAAARPASPARMPPPGSDYPLPDSQQWGPPLEQAPPPVPVQQDPRHDARPSDQGVCLRFNCGSSSRQHPRKQNSGIPNADAVEESSTLLGICDGVSGCHKIGIPPDTLPRELLHCCRDVHQHCASRVPDHEFDNGQWIVQMIQDAYNSSEALGATTMLLCSLRETGSLVTANLGDCSLLVLRPLPGLKLPMRTEVLFKTAPCRYDAKKPVQVQRLPGMPEAGTHHVIAGANLATLKVQHGDLLVLGSDGLYDNLQDEEIQRTVEKHCLMDLSLATGGAPTTAQLRDAAGALVNHAIGSVKLPPKNSEGSMASMCGNPDDTTALVAVIHQVDDPESYDRAFECTHTCRSNFGKYRTSSLRSAKSGPAMSGARMRTGSQPRSQAYGDDVLQDRTNFKGSSARSKTPPSGGAAYRGESMEPPCDEYTRRPGATAAHPPGRSVNNNCGRRSDRNSDYRSAPSWRREGSGERGRRGYADRDFTEEGIPREPPPCGPAAPKWWDNMAKPGSSKRAGSAGPPPEYARNSGRRSGPPPGMRPGVPQTARANQAWDANDEPQCVIA